VSEQGALAQAISNAGFVVFGIVMFCLVVWPLLTFLGDAMRAVAKKLREETHGRP